MTPLGRGIISSAKLGGASNFAKYNMSIFNASYGVVVPDNASLDLTDDFSGCDFVYPNNRSVTQRVMGKFESTGSNLSWAMGINTSGFLFFGHSVDGSAATFFTSTIEVPLSTLSLIHFRLTGGTLYLGINGASEQSTAKTACFSGTAPVEIGQNNSSQYCDDFNITQPMLFDSGSSAANFLTIYNSGMPCKYSLIDTAITDDAVMAFELSSNDISLTDLSTAGNDGAFVGGSFTNGQLITWKIGPEVSFVSYDAFLFDGVDDSINAGNDSSLQATAAGVFTSVWIYLDGTGDATQKILEKQPASGNREYILYKSSTDKLFFQVASGATIVTVLGATTLPSGEWLHVAGRCTGASGVVEVYINGVLDATIAAPSGAINASSNNLLIGKTISVASQMFKGSMVQPMVINEALLATTAAVIYNAGFPRQFADISTAITDSSVLAYAQNSNDNSLNDLSVNTNNGTASGGVTSNGQSITYEVPL